METITCKECGREMTAAGNFKKTRWGAYATVCNECAKKKFSATLAAKKEGFKGVADKQVTEARTARLANFSPRELMQELARRGYEGELTYTRVETIDITNF